MPAKLILIRHGQSIWNQENLFTGWVDIPLSEKGVQEALDAGDKIKKIPIDLIFTSTLVRAQMTIPLVLFKHESKKIPVFIHEDGEHKKWYDLCDQRAKDTLIPVYQSWHLNERMYGALQGLNKDETRKKYGKEQVHIWRRSFDTAPPDGESLAMTAERTLPYFEKQIIPHLQKGKNIMISAHGNSLRSIVMQIDHLSKEEVTSLELPTGEPRIYTFENGKYDLSR